MKYAKSSKTKLFGKQKQTFSYSYKKYVREPIIVEREKKKCEVCEKDPQKVILERH